MTRIQRRGVIALLCGALGAGVGYFGVTMIDGLQLEAGPGDRFEGLHPGFLTLGLIMLLMGTLIAAFSFSRRMIADNMGIDLAVERDVEPERAMARLQGLILVLAGFAMLLPALGHAPFGLSGEAAFAIVLALLVVESALNVHALRESDELLRLVTAEVCVWTFWTFQLVAFVWAVGAQFRLFPGFTPLDIVTVLMTLYLIASAVGAIRRGLGTAGN